MNAAPPTFEEIRRTAERLRRYLLPTPLRSYGTLDESVGARVLVKHENHQPTNSFKVRNGLAALLALSEDERQRGVIAATRGNHGAGVAWAGRLLGIPVTVCVPVGNNPEKNEAIRSLGAEVVEEGETYDDSVAVMDRIAADRGLRKVHSTNDPNVLAGAGSLTLEILEQAEAIGKHIDAMVLAVGGGSQAAGGVTVTRAVAPDVAVYGVQSAGASAIHDSCRAGQVLTHPRVSTFADGMATRTAYAMTFDTLRTGLADFVLVSDAEIADALRLLLRTTHNLAEGAGAAGLAGLRKLGDRLRGKTVAVVLSGSNIDRQTLTDVVSGRL